MLKDVENTCLMQFEDQTHELNVQIWESSSGSAGDNCIKVLLSVTHSGPSHAGRRLTP